MSTQFHLADLFNIVAAAVPERVAISDPQGQLHFGELQKRVEAFAAYLHQQGIGRGDKVGLYLHNGRAYIESFLAVVYVGAVPFNVNYRYQSSELQYLFSNADAKAVIYDDKYVSQAVDLQTALPFLELALAVSDYEPFVVRKGPFLHAYERDEQEYILQYTGGTTGQPKGVMWPHKAFFYACLGGGGIYVRKPPIEHPEQQAVMAQQSWPLRIFPLAPLMHGAAMWTALAGLLGGACLVLEPMYDGFSAEEIWDRVAKDQVNVLQIVGDAMALPLLAALQAFPQRWEVPSLVYFGSGGAVFSQHVKTAIQTQLPQITITDGMGASETGISGMGETTAEGVMRLPAHEQQQVITEGRFAQVGEMGVLARSGHIPIGYYNDPQKTAEIFIHINQQLWVLSGDMARLDADGMITLFGRGSTCINSGGEKIYPEEVETVLRAHTDIADVVVVGVPDAGWGEIVAAILAVEDGRSAPDLQTIQAFCVNTLARYKVPKQIKYVPHIERTPAGKQDYRWARLQFQIEDGTDEKP